MVIECGKPTEHYSSGRALLKAWDTNMNNLLSEGETRTAMMIYLTSTSLTPDEIDFIISCYNDYGGDINAMCPPSSDWMYWLVLAGIAIIILYMIGGKK